MRQIYNFYNGFLCVKLLFHLLYSYGYKSTLYNQSLNVFTLLINSNVILRMI